MSAAPLLFRSPAAAPGARDASGAAARRQVVLLSGFLGSGKTTLLRTELARSKSDPPAVIVNDVGDTVVDHALLTDGTRGPALISGGCACCIRRPDLARALTDLLDDEQRGVTAHRSQIVIETSGLADPGPIAFTLANDPVLRHHFTLARTCVTVDALLGLDTLRRHEVAVRQLLAADEVFVTKADLVEPARVQMLVERIHAWNPSATVTVTANGLPLRVVRPTTGAADRAAAGAAARGVGRAVSSAEGVRTHDVSTVEVMPGDGVDWQAFAAWLSLLLHAHGPDVLRVKGVLNVRDADPVTVNGVQHVVHRPEHLRGQGSAGSRLVFVVRGLDTALLTRSLGTFLALADDSRALCRSVR